MYALQFKFICTILLIATYLGLNEAVATGSGRRRFGQPKTKLISEEANNASTTDQTSAATTNNALKKYRRDGAYSSAADDFVYNTADINLIQSQKKPLHTTSGTKIRTKYSSSITIPYNAAEDTETAEEYVAKAVGLYGARLREPIHVSYESESKPTEELKYEQQPQQEKVSLQAEQLQQKYQADFPQTHNNEQRTNEEQKRINNEYYTIYQKDVRHDAYAPEKKEPTQIQNFYQYAKRPSVETEQPENYNQRLEQQYKERERPQLEQSKVQTAAVYEKQYENEYEKEPATRSYQIYEDQTETYDPAQQFLAEDQKYRNKFIYKPVQQYQENVKEPAKENEEIEENINESDTEKRIRVSSSTEIPKAEIMKQIEKSVIKYMKELEAEGKIVTTTQRQEPEQYFKVETITPTSEKSKTNKPPKPIGTYQEREQAATNRAANKKYTKNSQPSEETENVYRGGAAVQAVDAVLTPNVEFIYKIKTQTPLHAATVKTVSKPYNLALKSFEQFDHTKALKNLQEFDLTHVVTTPAAAAHQNAKHNKLYFNSEIYDDINAKTMKQQPRKETEYQPDYENYAASKSQGGYYAEPLPEREALTTNISEDGYPLMNPYQFTNKKEALPTRQEDSFANYDQQPQSQQTKKHNYNPLDYDSYNPKFNNNPESYGYQQTYKSHRHSASGKRGKRGGNHKKSSQRATFTDLEANVALRPPPKQ